MEQTPDGSVCVTRLSRQDIIDLFDLREALEVHAVRKVAMRGLADADMERLRDLSDSIRQWGQELGQKGASLTSDQTRRFKVQDMAFHTILFQAAENLRSLKTLNDVRRLIEVFTQRHAGLGIADLERGGMVSTLRSRCCNAAGTRLCGKSRSHCTIRKARLRDLKSLPDGNGRQLCVPVFLRFSNPNSQLRIPSHP